MPAEGSASNVREGAGERAGMEEGVGVEQDEVAALGGLDGAIVGYAEAEIDFAADEADRNARTGELRGDHIGGAVAGGVVDDQNLGR